LKNDELIVLFDGECNLCNASINFILRFDKKGKFRFASLQGFYGSTFRKKHIKLQQTDSVILIDNNNIYIESLAALRIAYRLGFPVSVICVFYLIPGFIRNALYRLVAKRRYQWFGKREICRLISADEASRFLK
jgi:predicted DCC family thiol-disulfide oxidoreductase YuxK